MAKARASGTPAKASRKASPAKSKAASPAPTTRTSPRRALPSAKAQEATDDRVQSGRVTKKTSPSKAATSAKKASPAKAATKKTSPAKAKTTTTAKEKQSPVRSSPAKVSPKKAGEKKVPTRPEEDPAEAKQFLKTHGYVEHHIAWYVRTHNVIEVLETSPTVNQLELQDNYELLLEYKSSLDGNVRKTDDEQTRQTRPIYRKLKKAMVNLLGEGVNECLKQEIDKRAFLASIVVGLTLNDHHANNKEVPRHLVPEIRVEHAYTGSGCLAGLSKHSILRRERRIAEGTYIEPRNLFRHADIGELIDTNHNRPSVSSSARARSKSPAKAPAAKRAASRSPAPIKNPKTRSKSPKKDSTVLGHENEPLEERAGRILESEWASDATKRHARTLLKSERASQNASSSARAASRSKSPAKVSSRPASTNTRQTRSRSKSPAEAEAAYRPAADDEDDEDGEDLMDEYDEEKVSPQKKNSTAKPTAKRAASISRKSPSPPKKPKTTSPTKPKTTTTKPKRSLSSAPTPRSPKPTPRSRSKSPIKPPTTSPRKPSTSSTSPSKKPTTQPYPRPHPSQPARGTVISPTNPQTIQRLNHKPNPFHETLPAPEIWHRRFPPYFPFGETPYMEKLAGEQIEEDLKRGAEDKLLRQQSRSDPSAGGGIISRVTGLASSAADAVRSTFSSPPKAEVARKRYPGMWDLPDVYGLDRSKSEKSSKQGQGERGKEKGRRYEDVVEVGDDSSEEEDEDEDEYMTGGLH